MKNIALIVAGGTGARMSGIMPKQYIELNGKAILRQTIERFLQHPGIHAVKVVIHPDHQELYKQATKGLTLLPVSFGGAQRNNSVLNGLRDLQALNPDTVLIHDSVRPFVSDSIISEVLSSLKQFKAVDVGVKPKDTVKEINAGIKVLNREMLYNTQTPQGFDFQTILSLHEKFKDKSVTDDISLALEQCIEVKVVEGSYANIKITTDDDLKGARSGNMTGMMKVGFGFDVHKFLPQADNTNQILLGGVGVPCEYKIDAHSDGDLVLHALTDALLGTLGGGDIGDYFPPSDHKWKNADSTIFLRAAANMVKEQKGSINNIDITIICETPKLYGYKASIQGSIAELLEINSNQVTVKGKTSEKIGAIGRCEGIAAQVVCAINYKNL